MATAKGVIQGFTGVAAVDGKHQVIVAAEAHGTGSEQGLLLPVVEALRPLLEDGSLITAVAGYHREANLKALETHRIESPIADHGLRQRDARLTDQIHHRQQPNPLYDIGAEPPPVALFRPADFTVRPDRQGRVAAWRASGCIATVRTLSCAASWVRRIAARCATAHRVPCVRGVCAPPEKTRTRQVVLCRGHLNPEHESATEQMRWRIDSAEGRAQYGRRFAI